MQGTVDARDHAAVDVIASLVAGGDAACGAAMDGGCQTAVMKSGLTSGITRAVIRPMMSHRISDK
jgi:hypothetical protein